MKKIILFLLIALLINGCNASGNDATSLIQNDNSVETIVHDTAPEQDDEVIVVHTSSHDPTVVPTEEPEVITTPNQTFTLITNYHPEPTIEPTVTPTTPEPPKQACPGGYNPDWDCGVRIDKAEAFKLFSVAEYGSVEAAFAACDVDGQITNEFHGVEVRSYGCSQQTRNDYGIWGFAIYYMDENGDIIY